MLAEWLRNILADGRPAIVGIDHGFSFPADFVTGLGCDTWDRFLDTFVERFPTGHQRVASVNRRGLPVTGFRLTERWTRSAKSVFDFGPNSVAFSTFAGLPWLRWIRQHVREQVHFWPFDGWVPPAGKSVVCEAYPAIRRGRVAIPKGFTDH